MKSVAEAQVLIVRHSRPLPPETLPLSSAALGLVLAEAVASDLDMPPYDKAMMDGYAVRIADLADGTGVLTVIEEVVAGQMPRLPVEAGQATRIMTGAPIPAGADAVVKIENTRLLDGNRVALEARSPKPEQNILRRGREMRRGDTVLSAGTVLRPPEFGVLATVGRTEAKLFPRPQVAVLATGDELVDAAQAPGPGQIRNSNGPMLVAQVTRAGGSPRLLPIARDDRQSLHEQIAEGLRSPLLILSGGVSAGRLDLVPGVLEELGVQPHFHKVAMKPGKPVFFGTCANRQEPGMFSTEWQPPVPPPSPLHPPPSILIFGLPGNPVSSLVCFELFVRPAIRRLMGQADPGTKLALLPLAEDFAYKTDRPTYYPARIEAGDFGYRVRPVPWFGSADLRGLTAANAFVLFPPGDHCHSAGQIFSVLPFSDAS